MLEEIRRGNRRALARFLTALENDRAAVAAELSQLYACAPDAAIIGVTGASGVGKSTLVAALARSLRKGERTVAILAVDPSSPITGGAILGDRIRMRALAGDTGVFIRSLAGRGQPGGLARATRDAVAVLAAASFDFVLVETIGAGQSEVEIAGLADTTLVVLAPGAGDSVQALKAGILEIADILVVNKSDLPGAEATARALKAMLGLKHPPEAPPVDQPLWQPPVISVSALNAAGIDDLVRSIAAHQDCLRASGRLELRRTAMMHSEFEAQLRAAWMQRLFDTFASGEIAGIIDRVAAREIDPQSAVDALLAQAHVCRRK